MINLLRKEKKKLSLATKKQQLTNAIRKNDKRIDAYYGIGFAYANNCKKMQVDCQKSIGYFTQVIALDSSYRHAFYNRANCYMVMGRYDEAISDLSNPISLSKADADYAGNRSYCYLQIGDTIHAHESYVQATRLNQDKTSEYMDKLFVDYFIRENK
jgi:tetratricopeptide (TPR) repeat protein